MLCSAGMAAQMRGLLGEVIQPEMWCAGKMVALLMSMEIGRPAAARYSSSPLNARSSTNPGRPGSTLTRLGTTVSAMQHWHATHSRSCNLPVTPQWELLQLHSMPKQA